MLSTLLEIAADGGSMVIGLVDADGRPVATRGWQVELVDADPSQSPLGRIIVVFHADEEVAGCLREGAGLSLTSANVFTYRAVQARGRIVSSGPADTGIAERTHERARRFTERVALAHHDSVANVLNMVPHTFHTATVDVDAVTDQSPRTAAVHSAKSNGSATT